MTNQAAALFWHRPSNARMECSVCLDRYTISGPKKPVLLPRCGHTFCETCAFHLCNQTALSTCPTCRTIIGAQQGSLLPNYALISVLSERTVPPHTSPATLRCSRHAPKDITAFCVSCGEFVCSSCCSFPIHGHVPLNSALRVLPVLFESVVQELTATHLATLQLIPELKKYKEKHLSFFDTASQQADVILRCRVEELIRFREAVRTTLTSLRKEWESFWEMLESSASGHAWFLETKLRDLLEPAADSETTVDTTTRKRDRSSAMGARKRIRLCRKGIERVAPPPQQRSGDNQPLVSTTFSLSPVICIETPPAVLEDIEDPASCFISQLQQLSLRSVSSSAPDGLQNAFPEPPCEPGVPNPMYRTETFRAIQVASLDTSLPSRSDGIPKTLPNAREMIEKLVSAWQTFKTVENLRGLLMRFSISNMKPPNAFCSELSTVPSLTPDYPVFRYPQVFPGLQPPLEFLLNVECRVLQPP